MTNDARLDAILSRLGDIETCNAEHHARVEGEMARIGDRINTLSERVKIQNGRVTASEQRLAELETKARITENTDAHIDVRHDLVATRLWTLISGSALVGLGALLGHFL